jgi:hypothetical protein
MTAHCRNTTLDALRDEVLDLTMRMGGTSDDGCETTALVSKYWTEMTAQ